MMGFNIGGAAGQEQAIQPIQNQPWVKMFTQRGQTNRISACSGHHCREVLLSDDVELVQTDLSPVGNDAN